MDNISFIFKVLWAPGQAMSEVVKRGAIFAPILLLAFVSLASTFITFRKIDPAAIAIQQSERQGRQLTAEQKAQMQQMMNSPILKGVGITFATIGPLISTTIITLIFFGIFTLVGREGTFKGFMAVTAHACVPLVIRLIAGILTVVMVPIDQIAMDEIGSISPALFIDRTGMNKMLFTAINSIDVITIWVLILLVIGYRFVTKKSVGTMTRAACVFGLWLLFVAIRVGFSSFIPS